MSIVLNDFLPISSWQVSKNSTILDADTGNIWPYEEDSSIRWKGALLVIATPIIHPVAAVCHVAWSALRAIGIVFGLVFYAPFSDNVPGFQEQMWTFAGRFLLQIVAAPVAVVGLEIAAIYTIFRPLDGRKLYASIERAEYDMSIAAPCFQPIYHHRNHFLVECGLI